MKYFGLVLVRADVCIIATSPRVLFMGILFTFPLFYAYHSLVVHALLVGLIILGIARTARDRSDLSFYVQGIFLGRLYCLSRQADAYNYYCDHLV